MNLLCLTELKLVKLIPTDGGTSRRSDSGVLLHVFNQLTDDSLINNSCMSNMRVTQLRLEFRDSVLSVV